MKMSAEEILRRYKEDSSHENLERIAAENGCTIREVGLFLKEAAKGENEEPKKKRPGRPKKSPETSKSSPSEETKSNKNKRKSSKVMSAECEMPPSIVMELVELKIHELERMIVVFEDKVNELKSQHDELVEFKERWQNGAKDGVHGKV